MVFFLWHRCGEFPTIALPLTTVILNIIQEILKSYLHFLSVLNTKMATSFYVKCNHRYILRIVPANILVTQKQGYYELICPEIYGFNNKRVSTHTVDITDIHSIAIQHIS